MTNEFWTFRTSANLFCNKFVIYWQEQYDECDWISFAAFCAMSI